MKRLLVIIFFLSLAIIPCMAQTSAQKNRKAKLEREIAILDAQLKENRKKSNTAQSSLNLVRRKMVSRKQLVAESEKEIKLLNEQIKAKQDTIAMLGARLDTMSAGYSRLVRTAYRSRDSRIWYMYLLASEDLGQGLRRYGYLRSLSSQMRTQAARIKEAQAVLAAQKAEAEALRKNAAKVRDTRLSELKKLSKEESESKKLVSQLSKNEKQYRKQLAAKQKEKEALDREMRRMVEKASKTSTGTKTVIDTKLDAEFAKNQGKLPWPADGPVIDSFGYRYHPVYKNVRLPFNNGINIALSPNTAVKSVFEGKVCQVIVMPGYNQCVLLQHGGYFTFYCKLANVSVKAGDKVKTGQVIGLVDTISGETQLHFELWEGKTPRNPENWLK
ncbi:MAG: murein hydrolase activator EnvC family protein [Candidatus Cryptobacteroides sp.]|jgi:septal ring factor EnvC (AmiA/AmiB activator)